MTEHVVVTRSPLIPVWRRGSVLAMVLVVLLALGVGTVLGLVLADDSSVTYRAAPAAPAQTASPAVGAASACVAAGPEGVSFLSLFAWFPNGAGGGSFPSLSPQVRNWFRAPAFTGQTADWGAP